LLKGAIKLKDQPEGLSLMRVGTKVVPPDTHCYVFELVRGRPNLLSMDEGYTTKYSRNPNGEKSPVG
jgi:hypothetical protein